MKKVIIVRLEIRLDCEKAKPTKVAPYVRYRNGKKELVKGYVRKKVRDHDQLRLVSYRIRAAKGRCPSVEGCLPAAYGNNC